MISIVIPACNEQNTILRCLNALACEEDSLTEMDVIVVANGCTDSTVALVREHNPDTRVIELAMPSKTAAINAGVASASCDEIVLIDADIEIDAQNIVALREGATRQNWTIASPRMLLDKSEASYPVTQYFRLAEQLSYNKQGKISQVIYLSSQAKSTLFPIPEIIADDAYLSAQTAEASQGVVFDSSYKAFAPADIKNLLKMMTRSHLGNIQLSKMGIQTRYFARAHLKELALVIIRPTYWIAALVFFYVRFSIRVNSRRFIGRLDSYQWQRDESNH